MQVRAAIMLLWIAFHAVPEARSQENRGRGAVSEAFLRTVATHFRISFREVEVLAAWEIPGEEIPVVLHLATRAGVSADVVVSLRRDGLAWLELYRRLGLGVGELYVPSQTGSGHSGGVYARFETRPRDEWIDLDLTDREVVTLVNVRVLSRELGAPPREVLRAYQETGDFMTVHRILGGPGTS